MARLSTKEAYAIVLKFCIYSQKGCILSDYALVGIIRIILEGVLY